MFFLGPERGVTGALSDVLNRPPGRAKSSPSMATEAVRRWPGRGDCSGVLRALECGVSWMRGICTLEGSAGRTTGELLPVSAGDR